MSLVNVLFDPVSNIFKNIETNWELVIETKVQGKMISTNNKRVGGGDSGGNNTNHVIKYFPRKTAGIGRGRGELSKEGWSRERQGENTRSRVRVSVTKQTFLNIIVGISLSVCWPVT